MPQPQHHSSQTTVRELVKRATDAGHVAPEVMADWLRHIADELAPPPQQSAEDRSDDDGPDVPPGARM